MLDRCLKITGILSLITIVGAIISCGVLINKIYNQYDPLVDSLFKKLVQDSNNITDVVNQAYFRFNNITSVFEAISKTGLNYVGQMAEDLNEIVIRIGAN